MTQEQFDRERRYCVTMTIVRELLSKGILSAKEYHKIGAILAGKFRPPVGHFLYGNP